MGNMPKMFSDASKEELISEQFVCKHWCHFRITSKERLELFFGKVI